MCKHVHAVHMKYPQPKEVGGNSSAITGSKAVKDQILNVEGLDNSRSSASTAALPTVSSSKDILEPSQSGMTETTL